MIQLWVMRSVLEFLLSSVMATVGTRSVCGICGWLPWRQFVLECRSWLGTTCQCTRRFILIISTRLFLASARASADRTLQAMNPSGILSGESAWYGKDVLAPMHAGVSRVAHAEVQFLCQEWTVHGWCDIKHVEGYTIASNTSKCKAVEFMSELAIRIGNVNCTFKSCDVPPSFVNTLHSSVERYFLDTVTCSCKSGYSLARTVLLQTRILFRVHV